MNLGNRYYRIYVIVRRLARTTGLIQPLRKYFGPLVGRFLLRKLAGQQRSFEINGHKMSLAMGDRYPPVDMAVGKYEEETTRLFQRLVAPGMAIIDVGAHVGYYTLLAARKTGPSGKVYAFEPEPGNYELLTSNIALNGYENIVTNRKVISNHVGSTALYISALDNGQHSIFSHDSSARESVDVETTTLDDFLSGVGWPKIGLIKVDVEGAELEVLGGMSQFLQSANPLNLIIEFNPLLLRSAGVDPLEFLGQDVWRGFEVLCIDEMKGPYPLTEGGHAALAGSLLANQRSVNLFCSRQ